VNIAVFFPAGGLLLLSSVLFFSWLMGKGIQLSGTRFDLRMLGWKNATRNRTRSMSIVILFAIGAFLVVSTGSNRKDLFENADDPGSGTGGFLFYAESTLPVLKNMNDPVVRGEEGLSGGYSLVQLRLAEGDDASCLNLNKIRNPRILGAGTGDLEGRFTFVSYTDEVDRDHPWRVLDKKLPGGLVPAVADETVIKWGLGLTVGDTLHYTNAGGGSMDLLLVGGLAPSIFQGSVIISSENFLDQYPASSGTRVFLVEGPADDSVGIRSELGMAFRDLGWDIQPAAARLSEFNSVTNAYLSIFMVMGALGLLLGIFGLAVVLTRSIQERRREIALLRAVGYGRRTIRRLIAREYLVLLGAGIGSGFLTAVVATLPSLVSSHTGASVAAILFWLAVLAVNGWIWIQVVARSSLRRLSLVKNLSND
jgi:putative ABC transport system permease protein